MRSCLVLVATLVLAGCNQPHKEEAIDTTLPDAAPPATMTTPEPQSELGAQGENLSDMADPGPAPTDADQPVEQADLAHGPNVSGISSLVTNDDYPPAALREGRGGLTNVSYQVDPHGRIVNCQLVDGSGSPDLDDALCRLLTRRARFSPATNELGEPILSEPQDYTLRWNPPSGE
ncbi:MAG TPA: TonB family protein [Sphingomonas sp.]|uniref:energy transducer TonB n=1 Tax=Sphingomonas sp. TaxID=28214 RepID=UPI002CB41717|nr:TonB family protein [Sphingomonas sp.]HMI20097.1 TonB family protein [Sphingomonas sp.]